MRTSEASCRISGLTSLSLSFLPPFSRLSITILCPAEFAQRSKDLVHLGATIRLRAIFISNKRVFADCTGDVGGRGRGDGDERREICHEFVL